MRQNPRAFVERCDFRTSVGFGDGAGDRERLGLRGAGPQIVITDLGILRPDPVTCELVLTDAAPRRHRRAGRRRPRAGRSRVADDDRRSPHAPTDERAGRAARRCKAAMKPVHVRVAARPGRVRRRARVAEVRRRGRARSALRGCSSIADAQAKALGDAVGRAARRPAGRRAWDEVVQHVPVELAERARAAATERRCGRRRVHRRRLVDRPGQGDRAAATGCRSSPCRRPTPAASRRRSTGSPAAATSRPARTSVVLPKVVVYDPELTLGLPPRVTGPSAFNALAHCVEALYAPGCNPVTSALALEGVRAIHRSLPTVMDAARRPRRPRRPALRRVPGRHGARHDGDRAAPQALPRARRHVQPRARRHPLGGPAPRGRVQRAGAARRDGAPGRGARRARAAIRRARCGTWPWPATCRRRWPTSACARRTCRRPRTRAAAEITVNPAPVDEAALAGLLERAFAGDRP